MLFEPLELVLERPGKLSRPSTAAVTTWMHDHFRLTTFACPDRATLAALEKEVLGQLDPPLNLMGMGPTPARLRMRELRRKLG